jgi:glycosyltransferase involved in cell wall biosynthesis
VILTTGSNPTEPPIVVLSANTAWFIANFCGGLVRALRASGYEPVAIAPRDQAAERILAQWQVRFLPVRIARSGLNPVTDARLLADYLHLLRRLRPAAYLGFTIKPNVYGSLAAGWLNIPVLPTVCGLGTAFIRRGLLQRIVRRMYRIAFRRRPILFFQNDDDRAFFLERGIVRSGQARVVPGFGIDLDRFSAAPNPHGPPVFLLIGRLLRDKGVIEFVEAARLLRPTLPAARFQLLGPIDESNRTSVGRAQLDAWVREEVVEYLGATNDVRPFIAASTAVVLPSYREGLPQTLLEAGAMARPSVATDVPGCRDIIVPGETGLLCAPRNAAALADALRQIASMPDDERLAMGQAARVRVEAEFSEPAAMGYYMKAMDQLTSRRPEA